MVFQVVMVIYRKQDFKTESFKLIYYLIYIHMNFNDFMSLLNNEFNRVQYTLNNTNFDYIDGGAGIKADLETVLQTLGKIIDSVQSIETFVNLF